jgi:hypothetical protein
MKGICRNSALSSKTKVTRYARGLDCISPDLTLKSISFKLGVSHLVHALTG